MDQRPRTNSNPQRRAPQQGAPRRNPQQASQRRGQPPRRRRKKSSPAKAVVIVLLVILILCAGGFIGVKLMNKDNKTENNTANTGATSAPVSVPDTEVDMSQVIADVNSDEESVGGLSEKNMVNIGDISVTPGLDESWTNILLLGSDMRVKGQSSRTDTMIICSVNRSTGEVKLTSILRDTAVTFDDIGRYNGTYRINAANYFGGPKLAMRTINEKFGMNIQYYVMVNFFGFQKIAQRVGGIEIDITEAEKKKINKMILKQAKFARREGIDESDQENVWLKDYGENTHLNGRQTLAYARIRKLTGGDAMRTERQRLVLEKLLEKVKQLDAIQLAALASDMIDQVKTNLPFDDIFALAMQVCGNGINSVEGLRLPISGSYVEEYRNDQSMLYDCDFQANALELYNFIYDN